MEGKVILLRQLVGVGVKFQLFSNAVVLSNLIAKFYSL